jgi:hypothetical protein
MPRPLGVAALVTWASATRLVQRRRNARLHRARRINEIPAVQTAMPYSDRGDADRAFASVSMRRGAPTSDSPAAD